MIGCLLVDITTWKRSNYKIEKPGEGVQIIDLSIIPEDMGCLCLHVKVENETQLWQMALNLESNDVMTGYGFGSLYSEARSAAIKIMERRRNNQNQKRAAY